MKNRGMDLGKGLFSRWGNRFKVEDTACVSVALRVFSGEVLSERQSAFGGFLYFKDLLVFGRISLLFRVLRVLRVLRVFGVLRRINSRGFVDMMLLR